MLCLQRSQHLVLPGKRERGERGRLGGARSRTRGAQLRQKEALVSNTAPGGPEEGTAHVTGPQGRWPRGRTVKSLVGPAIELPYVFPVLDSEDDAMWMEPKEREKASPAAEEASSSACGVGGCAVVCGLVL